MLQHLLICNPTDRISADESMQHHYFHDLSPAVKNSWNLNLHWLQTPNRNFLKLGLCDSFQSNFTFIFKFQCIYFVNQNDLLFYCTPKKNRIFRCDVKFVKTNGAQWLDFPYLAWRACTDNKWRKCLSRLHHFSMGAF